MTVKELKNALQDINEPIDRIAGFCDNYDQMFERCQINILEHAVQIDTIEDLFEPDSIPADSCPARRPGWLCGSL